MYGNQKEINDFKKTMMEIQELKYDFLHFLKSKLGNLFLSRLLTPHDIFHLSLNPASRISFYSSLPSFHLVDAKRNFKEKNRLWYMHVNKRIKANYAMIFFLNNCFKIRMKYIFHSLPKVMLNYLGFNQSKPTKIS